MAFFDPAQRRRSARIISGVLTVKFTIELYCLTVIATATALMWVPYVLARMMTHGVLRAIGTPGPGYPEDAPWVDRARRAHMNAIENLAVFAPLVLVAAVIDVSTKATVLSAQTYVVARLLHYVIYAAGVPVIRTLAFLMGACATITLAIALLLSGA